MQLNTILFRNLNMKQAHEIRIKNIIQAIAANTKRLVTRKSTLDYDLSVDW